MKTGFLAGSFDIIHPGYAEMFREAKQHCDTLIVGLHDKKHIEGTPKLPIVLSYEDRHNVLSSIRYVDTIYRYVTEEDLLKLLIDINPDIRFVGEDYRNMKYTGDDLNIQIYYCNRNHGWSTTKLKKMIYNSILECDEMI